jgi:hypothetical protein
MSLTREQLAAMPSIDDYTRRLVGELITERDAALAKRACQTCGGDGFIQIPTGHANAEGDHEEWKPEPCPECDLVTKLTAERDTARAEANGYAQQAAVLRRERDEARAQYDALWGQIRDSFRAHSIDLGEGSWVEQVHRWGFMTAELARERDEALAAAEMAKGLAGDACDERDRLLAQRDEARCTSALHVAAAERAMRERDEARAEVALWKKVTGRDDAEGLDFALGRAGIDYHLDLLTKMRDAANARAERACAEAARLREALEVADGSHRHADDCPRSSGAKVFIPTHVCSDCGANMETMEQVRAALSAPESSAWLEAKLAEAHARGFREARDAALAIIRETPFAAGTLVGAKQADMRRRMEERVAALAPSAERAEPAPVCATCGGPLDGSRCDEDCHSSQRGGGQ